MISQRLYFTICYSHNRYIELLKVEKSSDSTPRSSDKDLQDHGSKKSILEMERTIFTLKGIIEKLHVENKRLKLGSKKNHIVHQAGERFNFFNFSFNVAYAFNFVANTR